MSLNPMLGAPARTLCLGLGLLCGTFSAAGCEGVDTAPAAPAAMPPTAVEALTLAPAQLRETVEYLGVLRSRESVDIRPQVSGYVRAIHVHSGDQVEAGAALVAIDAREEAAAVDSARAQVTGARARLSQARRDLARIQALENEGLASAEERDRAESAVELIEASIQEAEAAVSQRRVQLQFAAVTAPSAGVIGDIPIRVGESVAAGQALMTLTQLAQLELSIAIPVDRARTVREGETLVEVLGADGEVQIVSPIFYVAPRADPRTQLVEVKVRIDNSVGLRESELVRSRVVYSEGQALVVPPLAVVRQSGQAYLFVLTDTDGALSVARSPVTLALLRPEGYEVLSGLVAGDRIATSSLPSLRDGAAVTVAAAAAPTAPAAAPTAPAAEGSAPAAEGSAP